MMLRLNGGVMLGAPPLVSHCSVWSQAPVVWVPAQCWQSHRLVRHRGSVVKRAEEAYLREDVACGSRACATCCAAAPCRLAPQTDHLVVPDAATLEALLEVFELPEMRGFVMLTSVLREV
jgi:DIS3-like exonuclease 1